METEKTSNRPKNYNKLRKIELLDKKNIIEWQITNRFIEEVEILEKEGRVENRDKIEIDLAIVPNGITGMRAGKNKVSVASIHLFKLKYNADIQFIMFGVRDKEHSGSILGGRKLNVHKPYVYKYRRSHKPKGPFAEKQEKEETANTN